MELGAIFLLLGLAVLVGLFVSRPFMEQRRAIFVSVEEHELSALLAERDRLITALQELDFDHVLGKIPTEDYPNMRAALLGHAAEVLRHIDELEPQKTAASFAPADAESRVEAAIAARRADASAKAPVSALNDDDLEDLIAARRAQRKEKSGGFCPNCGKPVLRSDRFCPACGKSIK